MTFCLQDELLWGAAWLQRASKSVSYLSYIQSNGQTFGADDNVNIFSWDEKHAGTRVLLAKVSLYCTNKTHSLNYVGLCSHHPCPLWCHHSCSVWCQKVVILLSQLNYSPKFLVLIKSNFKFLITQTHFKNHFMKIKSLSL